MATVTVSASKDIHRSLGVVHAQFTDFQHHIAHGVHDGLEMTIHSSSDKSWDMTWAFKAFGLTRRDRVLIAVQDDGSLRYDFTDGPSQGTEAVVSFEALDADTTRVVQTTTVAVRGLLALIAPLVRRKVASDLATGLEQDRIDLEERGYPR